MATVPGAIYPVNPFTPGYTSKMQTPPDKFTPPAFWGTYPHYSQNGQTSRINTRYPDPPWEAGPGYGFNGGQHVGLVNANPAVPLAPQPPDTPA